LRASDVCDLRFEPKPSDVEGVSSEILEKPCDT
jgi:hypothetical protein